MISEVGKGRMRALFAEFYQSNYGGKKDWLDEYTAFVKQIAGLRKQGVKELDRDLCERLLMTRFNGIADPGQWFASTMTKEAFNGLMADAEFVKTLYVFFKIQTPRTYEAFSKAWKLKVKAFGVKFSPLRVNRVAAAFTTRVSCFCDEMQFNEVLLWLHDNGLVKLLSSDNWFSDNEKLAAEIDSMLEGELGFDKFSRGVFLWWLWSKNVKKQTV